MNKKLLAGVGIVILLSLGAIYIRNQQSSSNDGLMPSPTSVMEKDYDTMTKPTDAMMEKTENKDESMKKDDGAMMKNESRYVVYSQTSFDAAKDKKRILFFHAPWCPTCRPADAAFQKDSALIPEGVVLFKTDYDTSTDLKKKHNVTYQHTFVQVDASGNAVTKWNGGQITELIANIK